MLAVVEVVGSLWGVGTKGDPPLLILAGPKFLRICIIYLSIGGSGIGIGISIDIKAKPKRKADGRGGRSGDAEICIDIVREGPCFPGERSKQKPMYAEIKYRH